jgi:hypothetical protein
MQGSQQGIFLFERGAKMKIAVIAGLFAERNMYVKSRQIKFD